MAKTTNATKPNVPAPVVPPKGNLPALPDDWMKQLAESAKEAAKQEPVTGKFISLKGGHMSFQGNPIPGNRMNVIVLDAIIEHQYYVGEFNPEQAASPLCYAFGREAPTMEPHIMSAKKQSDVCASCEQFKWGSDPKGRKGKACKEVRRLALLDGSLIEKGVDAVLAGEVVFAKIPVTSVRAWASYVSQLSNVMQRPPFGVVTDFALKPDPRTTFTCQFAFAASIDDPAILQAITERRKNLVIDFPYPSGVQAEQKPQQAQQPTMPRRY